VVVLEARSPVGSSQERLKGTSYIDEAVEHQEEHGEERSEDVDVTQQHAKLTESCNYENKRILYVKQIT